MAHNYTVAGAQKAASLDAELNPSDSGFIDVYSGTQPTGPDTALSGNTLLASLGLSATAFAAAVSGTNSATKTANAITSGVAGNTGTASFFRIFKSDHTTAVADGTVGVGSTFDMQLATTTINSGVTVSCSSCVITR
jgi:hypothetical protein